MSACARASDGWRTLAAAALALSLAATATPPATAQTPATAPGCDPVGELGFVCGARNPEDLVRIPGSRWLIASGFADGGSLNLVDTRARALERWFVGAPDQMDADRIRFPHCPGTPQAERLNLQGLHLRREVDGKLTLYAANHGGREAIEIFRVDVGGEEPRVRWLGCLPLPAGRAANSVTTLPDGTVLATELIRPGTAITDYVQQRVTGGVYAWRPGDNAFRLLPGTELPGDNGIEASRDGKYFYVVAFGWHAILVYAMADTSRPLKRIEAPDFMPDNLHWDGDRLIAAGMRYDEPACGGRRKIIDGVADMMFCHRGYVVAEFDPDAGLFRTIAYAEPNPGFNAASAAVIVDGELWMGAFRSDRIAYRRLGRLRGPAIARRAGAPEDRPILPRRLSPHPRNRFAAREGGGAP